MKWLRFLAHRLYTTWCVFWFVLPFVVIFPVLRVLSAYPKTKYAAHLLHRAWAWAALFFFLLPVKAQGLDKITPKKQRYVLCPNHSSYTDILMLLRTVPGFLNFVGKSSLAKTPLWGRIYANLYICVDRKSRMSKARSYAQAKQSLQHGRSMVIFPEGKISSDHAGNELLPFHVGAFRLAIEQQVPLVPVTMPYNHLFLPDLNGKLRVRWHPLTIIFHEPISTEGLTLDDTEWLKNRVYSIIQAELNRHQPHHANQHRNPAHTGTLSPTGV